MLRTEAESNKLRLKKRKNRFKSKEPQTTLFYEPLCRIIKKFETKSCDYKSSGHFKTKLCVLK
ncbi:MAG: hypothetical protein A3G51_03980 [Candidatus Yanofskybacteria bacterium RIFCSPLOWO2_12_FULL_43_11b]|uniref:Uncharacterized protein n=1 Tax=Candidatus Yanofskybacteria bacterium RIFCSPLOWO2_12_FULL_43_11b TaxID=1802710 RepID=A0A1F8H862_9BACT|nr:MAG: hypothetical protein A2742_00430 [Candidatus Yanofskybacteria bacterium RIFCSPHIGHO2_01_FULL_43_32]OGN18177.1 MAG: hypothetical protein A3E34_02965 [Candidatus Yanofskybacteria bacterium RIFCSPHIGHO2_12_FULL_43_11]OGN24153.1 MAG: hypothetical protein A2923_02370 [Candidatus Yanofskybacteria bacterium RIFCSPLOWO2_01_FULL_43_46]OGN33787.1 MAG: hypothetical protein A3G51_03980 [Candidatus Yanofskybacteria bacterium RIFCSPLOWO2_12_FULL_43_11b]